jgi:hypothetical protein
VKKALLIVRAGRTLSHAEKILLINAYQFLYDERLPNLFNDCTAALWGHFETSGETGNLLRLFRHSSLIWRLGGDDSRERAHLVKLAAYAQAIDKDAQRELSKERTYYKVRASLLPAGAAAQVAQLATNGSHSPGTVVHP